MAPVEKASILLFLFLHNSVGGALDVYPGAIHHMGVDHGGSDVFMPQKFLDRANIRAILQQMGGEGVPQSMATDLFGKAAFPGRRRHRFL